MATGTTSTSVAVSWPTCSGGRTSEKVVAGMVGNPRVGGDQSIRPAPLRPQRPPGTQVLGVAPAAAAGPGPTVDPDPSPLAPPTLPGEGTAKEKSAVVQSDGVWVITTSWPELPGNCQTPSPGSAARQARAGSFVWKPV